MADEIERKFLLDELPDRLQSCSVVRIDQGYLAIAAETEVRLRKADNQRLLTVKRGAGEVREEVEVALDPEQFDALWPLTEPRRLEKSRYLVPLDDGHSAEVDIYRGDLEGLAVVEVEFDSEAQSRDFRGPAWLGEEVTGDGRYANQRLALDGLPGA
jgi:CYTH domain-containing protein